uniref:O-GlcNAc transferase C-terminal domain-containing protein n=1 Tax=Minutocellus polymorphus TaxID=265543 RepID=A0A7S0FSR0_9STRA
MGFPTTCGCPPLIDYLVCDKITIPYHLRQYYSERLLYMPNCFFVNSHRFLPTNGMNDSYFREVPRGEIGLPEDGFIFCAHHRSDKLDPRTFRSWLQALTRVPASYLWVLTAGEEMEQNLRAIASGEFGLEENRLIFCKKVPRSDHLLRLRLADLFLDTPAYNAHTTGCDSLVNGIPMVSLLRLHVVPTNENDVDTEKMPSRVGASFLRTLDLNELIATDMAEYEDIMVRCATDAQWYNNVKERLRINRFASPLFDTDRWMKTWEAGLKDVVAKDDITDTLHIVER